MKSARRTLTLAVVGALALLSLAGCAWPLPPTAASTKASSTAPKAPDLHGSEFITSVPYGDVKVGQCTDIAVDSPVYDTVTILGCTKPHASEVFHTFRFPDGDFPSEDQMATVAEAECGAAYKSHVPGWLTYVWLEPTSDEWANGGRVGVCFAADQRDTALTEPLSVMINQPPPSTAAILKGAATGVAIFAIVLAAVAVLAGYLLLALGLTRLFRKVGVPVWKAWVPYVQTWTLLRLGGQNGNWVWLLIVPVAGWVTAVFLYVGMYRIGLAFRKDAGMLVLGIFLPFVWAFLLGRPAEVYAPELLAASGYPAPLEGYGSRQS